jgi:hypothetical protein
MNKPMWVMSKYVRPEHNGKRIEAVARGTWFRLRVIGHSTDVSKVAIAIEEPSVIDPPYLTQAVADKIVPNPDQNVAEFQLPDR